MTTLLVAEADVVVRGLVALLESAGRSVVVRPDLGPHPAAWPLASAVVALSDTAQALEVTQRLVPVPTVVLHRTTRRADRDAAWRAGAAAWAPLDLTAAELTALLDAAEEGVRSFAPAPPRALCGGPVPTRRSSDPDPLTPREAQIVAMVVAGHTNKQIAARLGVAEQTVKNHLVRTMGKAGVTSRLQLYGWAVSRSA